MHANAVRAGHRTLLLAGNAQAGSAQRLQPAADRVGPTDNRLDAQDAGYDTAVVGKWHLGLGWQPAAANGTGDETTGRANETAIDLTKPLTDTPNALGFGESYVIPASLDFPPYVYIHNDRVTDPTTTEQPAQSFPAFLRKGPRSNALVMEDALDHLTGKAVDFIAGRTDRREPFFLYFPMTAPHKPALPHRRFRGRSGLGDYGDFIMQVDWTVGEVLNALDRAKLADDTLVFYTSDNGSYMHRLDDSDAVDHVEDATVQGYRPEHHRANGSLRGTKADIWEAGHRVPFLVRWPGKIDAGTRHDETVCITDLMATCAEIAGGKLRENAAEDSYSLCGLLQSDDEFERPPVIHHSAGGMFAIRDGRWKLVAGNGSGGRQKPKGEPFARPYALFDLEADLAEEHDCIEKHPEIAKRLEAALEKIREDGRSVSR